MLKVQISLEKIDFNSLIDLFLPVLTDKLVREKSSMSKLLSGSIPPSVLKAVFASMSEENKERMAAELINSNAAVISERVREFARLQNVDFTVAGIQAEV